MIGGRRQIFGALSRHPVGNVSLLAMQFSLQKVILSRERSILIADYIMQFFHSAL